jgi:hypothetical protein
MNNGDKSTFTPCGLAHTTLNLPQCKSKITSGLGGSSNAFSFAKIRVVSAHGMVKRRLIMSRDPTSVGTGVW